MTLGGFGRGWRRPDHRIFLPSYTKTPIGCHWQWTNAGSLPASIHVQSSEGLEQLIKSSREVAMCWLNSTGRRSGEAANWREVIHPERMAIWVRMAEGPEDAKVIRWFHQRSGETSGLLDPSALKDTPLAGRMNLVGLLWNRMLPLEDQSSASSAAASARPGSATERPAATPAHLRAAALARPQRRAGDRTTKVAPAARGEVSIQSWTGPYLECLVLCNRNYAPRFTEALNGGAAANFVPIDFGKKG
jgi:CRISPR-associated protein Cmr6